ncbi:unnamed protein product [Arctogadus glacialis]
MLLTSIFVYTLIFLYFILLSPSLYSALYFLSQTTEEQPWICRNDRSTLASLFAIFVCSTRVFAPLLPPVISVIGHKACIPNTLHKLHICTHFLLT